jgi:hypothetical protein
MDELGELILGERPKVEKQPNLVAPKKSPMSGLNPQLQYNEPQDELGQLILNGRGTETPEPAGNLEKTLGTFQEMRKNVPGFLASTADVIASAPSFVASTAGYIVPRALGGISRALGGRAESQLTPEEITQGASRVTNQLTQPVGRATGLAETQAYKQALPTKVMEIVGQFIGESADAISKKTGIPVQDVEQAINLYTVALGATGAAGIPLAKQKFKQGVQAFKEAKAELTPVGQQMQAQLQAKQGGLQSGGAAATELSTTIQTELASAPEHIKQAYANIPPNQYTPADLQYIQTHKLFEKFKDTPTEGQALQDARLMSEEYNNRNREENKPLQEKFAQRDAKVITALEDTKQRITPDVHEVTPQGAANLTLEKIVANDEAHQESIRKDYKELANANGGELPLDVNGIVNNADVALKKARIVTPKTSFLPKSIEDILNELRPETKDGAVIKEAQPITYDDYLNYIKILNNEYRKATAANDPNAAFGIKLVRDAFENTDMVGKTAEVNALAKKAKANAKSRFDKLDPKSDKYIPAYQAAVEGDIRTNAEKLANIQHPAANQFIDKFYGNKTPEVYLNRLLDEIGRDTPEHQGLNAALLEGLKSRAGIKGTQGKPSQAAINSFINDPVKGYATNLKTMLGNENLKELQDFADYARMTDHSAISGNYANLSGSGMVVNTGPMAQAIEKGGSLLGSAIEHGINAKTLSPAGTIARTFFKGRAEEKAAQALKAEQQKKLNQTLQPKPPSKLSDIGK